MSKYRYKFNTENEDYPTEAKQWKGDFLEEGFPDALMPVIPNKAGDLLDSFEADKCIICERALNEHALLDSLWLACPGDWICTYESGDIFIEPKDKFEQDYEPWTETITLATLQEQHVAWRKHNFGDGPTWEPLLGMIEEVGELSHAHLKTEHNDDDWEPQFVILRMADLLGKIAHGYLKAKQKIRGDQAKHVGSVLNSLDELEYYIQRFGDAFDPPFQTFPETISWLNESIADLPEPKDTREDGLADTLVYAADYANRIGVDLTQELSDTWAGNEVKGRKGVRDRDWTKDPARPVSVETEKEKD